MNESQLLAQFDRVSEAPDAIPRLRRFILDLAVRGKLVEQDPNDEPASELVRRGDDQAVNLVKTGAIRNQKAPFVMADEAQPYGLPRGWEWVRFGRIADYGAGATPSRHESRFWNTGEYAWVSIADMPDGGVVHGTKETISEGARSTVFHGDPLPVGTMIMSFKLTIGKISRLGIPAFHNEAIITIRPHLAELQSYLFMVLPEFSRQGDTKGAIKGATLNRESLANILVPLPPLAEQHRIVAKVDELMALCGRLEAAQAERERLSRQLLEAVLHEALTGRETAA